MIEMDRFVQPLSGAPDQTIERLSIESAATMKEQGTTLKRSQFNFSLLFWNPFLG